MSLDIIEFNDFLKVKICVGTIISVEQNEKLKKSSFILTIDFGKDLGLKKSSAQLRVNYDADKLIDKQIIAVVNFKSKQIGNIMSDVLVLGLPDNSNDMGDSFTVTIYTQ